MFANVFLFFCCCCTAAVCGLDIEIEREQYTPGFDCIKLVETKHFELYFQTDLTPTTMHMFDSDQDDLPRAMLAAYMNPVRCNVVGHKESPSDSIALNQGSLTEAIWTNQKPMMSKSFVCVCSV